MAFDLKDYVDVAERLRELYTKHPTARVVTELIEHSEKRVTVKASVYRDAADAEPAGVDYSSLAIPGSTPYTKGAELENASTSATGRAIVLAGIPSKRIASADEIEAKRTSAPAQALTAPAPTQEPDLYAAAKNIFADDVVVIPDQNKAALDAAVRFAGSVADAECPVHRKAWTLKPGGVSKTTGKEYGAFYTCSEKTEDGWCKAKPKASWVTAQGLGR